MTWFLTFILCLSTGGLRFIEGSSDEKIPSGLLKAGMFLSIGGVALLASSSWPVSVVVAFASVGTISAGFTDWKDLFIQVCRGTVGFLGVLLCLALTSLIMPLDFVLPLSSALGMLGLHIIAFAFYWLEGKVKPPFCELEQAARVVQGVCICGAASLV